MSDDTPSSVLIRNLVCDLTGCDETYNNSERDYVEVRLEKESTLDASRFCSVNCAKTALMREERERKDG
jgi:hypothetical protein